MRCAVIHHACIAAANNADYHRRLVDLQFAIRGLYIELFCYNIAFSILHNRCAADRVRHGRNIRAARIARRQAFHCVGVAIHCEAQRLEACRTLRLSVICRFRAVRNNRDLILLSTIRDRQLTSRLRRQAVVIGYVYFALAIGNDNLQVVRIHTIVIRIDQFAARRSVADRRRLAIHYVRKGVFAVAALFGAVIFDCLVFHGHGDLALCDDQAAVCYAECYIDVRVAIAELFRCQAHCVGARIGFADAFASGMTYQVRIEQRALACRGIAAHFMRCAVIHHIGATVACNGHRHGCLTNGQRTRCECYIIVGRNSIFFCTCLVFLRTISNIGDGWSSSDRIFNRLNIARQCAFNRIRTV